MGAGHGIAAGGFELPQAINYPSEAGADLGSGVLFHTIGKNLMIPLSVPCLAGNEWKYVKECLDTGWVSTAGGYVTRFEEELKQQTGAVHAVACVSGTAALHVALQVAGVTRGDEVLVPTLTFIASVNAISYLGAHQVFMDCDDFYNLDVAKLAEFLELECEQRDGATFNRRSGRRVAAVVPVHVFGNAVRIREMVDLCRPRGIRIIEDAAESLGTTYDDGAHAGTIGDLGCFSFNGNKIVTTGGGGMIVTADAELAHRARYLTTQAKDDEVRFIHGEIGYNYRLTNLQAALGVAQLEQLGRYVQIKRDNYQAYRQALNPVAGLSVADVPPYAHNNCWMYALRIDAASYGLTRDEVLADLDARGIQTRPVWYPNHLQKAYRHCQTYRLEHCMKLFDETLNIPCSVGLSEAQRDAVIGALSR